MKLIQNNEEQHLRVHSKKQKKTNQVLSSRGEGKGIKQMNKKACSGYLFSINLYTSKPHQTGKKYSCQTVPYDKKDG